MKSDFIKQKWPGPLVTKLSPLIILLMMAWATGVAQTISVAPSRVFFTGNPGETVTQAISFYNPSADSISFITRIDDWERDSTGVKKYYPGSTLPGSNAENLMLSANTISVPPYSTREVIVSLAIPTVQEKNRQTHSMVFFKQVKKQKNGLQPKGSIGLNILLEVGVQIYYTPYGSSAGDINIVAFNDDGLIIKGKDTLRKVALKIKNTGDINKDANIRFELTNKSSGAEIKIDPVAVAMLPGATQWVYACLPGNLQGAYVALAIIDAGPSYDLKVAQKDISYDH
jgi:hypothetical protein